MAAKTLKIFSKTINVILMVLLVITAILVFTNLTSEGSPKIFGQELKVVYSGSMEPEIKTGSVIGVIPAIDKNSYQVNDVIMFQQSPGVYVTHRIIDVFQNESGVLYQTKGDNNAQADVNPVLASNVYGLHSGFHVPYLGYAMDFANSQFGLVTLLLIPGILLLIHSGKTLYVGIRELKAEKAQVAASSESNQS
ncbi:signal peptidase I SipW [Alkalihalobacterium sp. APHAB7]|uniref:signal peptidase I SipW n=1 Tax=Alkalihalobacterium sp. APHAB7 TaxID=3402081 RepID=UPI003AAD662B